MKTRTDNERGTVLVTTLFIALLVGVVVAALLVISQQQNYLTARSQTWSSEIPLAEAGIEEALAHINSRPKTLATNGWIRSGDYWVKTRTNFSSDGYYHVAISRGTNGSPAITSIGYGRVPLSTNYTQRSVFVQTKLAPPKFGIVARQQLSMNGNPLINSYNSSDPDLSNNGFYDPNKPGDRVGVAVLSSLTPGIDTGSGKIYGYAATGPGGTVVGNVGDGDFLSDSSGLQPGHVTDDFNTAIPEATLPANFSSTPQTVPQLGSELGGTLSHFTYVLAPGDWKLGAVDFNSDGGIYVQGSVRIWIDGDLKMSGAASVTLAPGTTVEIYVGNPTSLSPVEMDLSGHCVINPTGIPANCSIYGLQNCTSMKYTGEAAAYCKLYAPNADIQVGGQYDFSGSIVGNNIRFSGNSQIHYDEALSGEAATYHRVVAWQEL